MTDNLDLSILKYITSNKKHAFDFVNEFDAKLFLSEYWAFANIVIGYIKTVRELPTLRVITERLSKGNNEKLIESLTKTWEAVERLENDEREFKHDVEKLKRRFAEKQITTARDALAKCEPGSIDISRTISDLQKTIQNIKSLDNQKVYENCSVRDHLPIFVEKFNAKKNNPNLDIGLMTKYSFLDFSTNGLRPADFLLIAGESGFGKSMLLNNIAIQVWLQDNNIFENPTPAKHLTGGKDIIYFSLEMPYEDCFNRFLSRLSGVPFRKIENSSLNKEEFNKIKTCLDFIKEYPYDFKIIDIAKACANDLDVIIENTGKEWDSIFVDYLGIMDTNEKNDEADWLKQGVISFELRQLCRKYKKPLFSAVQLNRKAATKEPADNIGLSRLARSGTIATHATHVIQIESRSQEENYPDFLYHLIKNRKGPKGKGILLKHFSCATLIDKVNEENTNKSNNTSNDRMDDYFKDQDDISEQIEDLEL